MFIAISSTLYMCIILWNVGGTVENIRDLPALSVFRQCIRKFDLNSLLADAHCSDCILCHT